MLPLSDRRRLPRRLAGPCPHFRLRACPSRACAPRAWLSSAPAPPAGPHEAWWNTSTLQFPHRPSKNVVTLARRLLRPGGSHGHLSTARTRASHGGGGKLRGRKLSQLETPVAELAESRRRGRVRGPRMWFPLRQAMTVASLSREYFGYQPGHVLAIRTPRLLRVSVAMETEPPAYGRR